MAFKHKDQWLPTVFLAFMFITLILYYIDSFTALPYVVLVLLTYYWRKEYIPSIKDIEQRKDLFVIIVGGGYGGICSAIKLKQQHINFVIIEKSSSIGGTWWQNKYPGCACDVNSHLYSFSFFPNPFWSKSYSSKNEILEYMQNICEYYGLNSHLKLDTKVEECFFDKQSQKWTVHTSNGEKITGNYLISSLGLLSIPKTPYIKGKEEFLGEQFHTAQWNKQFDYKNKRIGIIGTGCSAVQVVPNIAPHVDHLYVFQRTPPWVVEHLYFDYPWFIQKLFLYFPIIMKFHRWYLFFRGEFFFFLNFTKGSILGKKLQKSIKEWMESQIDDEVLREKMIPDYDLGCKRITISKWYLKTFNRANVTLVDNSIESITPEGIRVKDGENDFKEIQLDAIVYATGFNLIQSMSNMDVHRPSDGKKLSEIWDNTPNAYLGIMYPGLPNFFTLYGPNTNLGHNSIIWMMECQANFLIDAIIKTNSKGMNSIDVKEEENERYQNYIRNEMKKRVYGSGCVSWYQNSSGFNFSTWPSYCTNYWWKTLWVNLNHFIVR